MKREGTERSQRKNRRTSWKLPWSSQTVRIQGKKSAWLILLLDCPGRKDGMQRCVEGSRHQLELFYSPDLMQPWPPFTFTYIFVFLVLIFILINLNFRLFIFLISINLRCHIFNCWLLSHCLFTWLHQPQTNRGLPTLWLLRCRTTRLSQRMWLLSIFFIPLHRGTLLGYWKKKRARGRPVNWHEWMRLITVKEG